MTTLEPAGKAADACRNFVLLPASISWQHLAFPLHLESSRPLPREGGGGHSGFFPCSNISAPLFRTIFQLQIQHLTLNLGFCTALKTKCV